MTTLPYCGTPPSPGELLSRFNLDPALIGALVTLAVTHYLLARDSRMRAQATLGWALAATALISPLCALSVSLFAARITQHMVLLLAAAPLIALALPVKNNSHGRQRLAVFTVVFFGALWFWHMPAPYDATFSSTWIYWLMHITLFGSAVLLWRELLHHSPQDIGAALFCGLLTSMQMGLLGAILTLASHPLFSAHFTTSALWGLTPLQDQQLGGTIMWVPGIALFLWVALRSLRRLWTVLGAPKAT
jgi:putative membrane protein